MCDIGRAKPKKQVLTGIYGLSRRIGKSVERSLDKQFPRKP